MNITNNATMYLKVQGKLFKVQHIALTVDEANEVMTKNKNLGALCESDDGLIYLCNMDDKGHPCYGL